MWVHECENLEFYYLILLSVLQGTPKAHLHLLQIDLNDFSDLGST